MTGAPLLHLENVSVRFGTVEAVRNLNLTIGEGETAALVGESGSGKSVTALALLGLLPERARVDGTAVFAGKNLIGLPRRQLDEIRGRTISLVFQEPQSALDPLFTVGSQIAAVLRRAGGLGRRAALARAVDLMAETGIADPARRAGSFPHELSGGQRQRVAIAMAMACEPRLLIADEPTTALDVTVAARILDLLKALQERHGMALLLISHDLGLVRRAAQTVHVMQHGRLVETASVEALASGGQHSYTRRLLAAERLALQAPQVAPAAGADLVDVRDLTVCYQSRGGGGAFTAVDRVSLSVQPGETLGIIGESGSGKSSLGRAILRLQPATGSISFEGRDLQKLSQQQLRPLRKDLQIVFQDPFSSLSPRLSVADIVTEGLRVHGDARDGAARLDAAASMLDEVGLPGDYLRRRPSELSGGQRQRVAIARALILSPRFVVLDEPTSALDRSVQAEVLALLRRLQDRHGLTYLLITHDLAVIRAMATRTGVMQGGRLVEIGPTPQILTDPQQPYTAELVSAAMAAEPMQSLVPEPET